MSNPIKDNYRQDIAGLRAIAVLIVVAFHFGMNELAPGGFIGVDVFFVISGYLISGILFRDIKNGVISIRNFYARRVRRIFPALFVVYVACVIRSLLIDFPSDSAKIGSAIISSIFFFSNIYFSNSKGYFSSALESNPLLHTWSLSVEEQFYLLFPVLILAIRHLQRNTQLAVIVICTILSFCASTLAVFTEPTSAFYFVHNRAWELLIGALLALAPLPLIKQRWGLELLAVFGLLLIVMSNFLLSPASNFPGPYALAACAGAVLLIYSGASNQTSVSKILSIAPARFIGLISYSLYLWHWPLLVFTKQFYEHKGLVEKSAILALCIFVAYLSWQFIEQPFRQKSFQLSDTQTLCLGGAFMLLVSIIAMTMSPINRMIWHTPKTVDDFLAFESYESNEAMRSGSCFLNSKFNKFSMFDKEKCLHIDPKKQNYLVIGDSHAAHLWYGLQIAFPQINFLQATSSGCRPVLEIKGTEFCIDLMRFMFEKYIPEHHIDGVILSARWGSSEVEVALRTSAFVSGHANKVIISGPIQEYDQAFPRILALAASSRVDYGEFAASHRKSEQLVTDGLFAQSILPIKVEYFSAYNALNKPGCHLVLNGNVPVQFDYGHLTKDGSVCVAKQMGANFFK